MTTSPKPISLRVARQLIEAKTGIPVKLGRLKRLARGLSYDDRLAPEAVADDKILPDDLDRLTGEVIRNVAGWYQKRNVKGDFLAWVLRLGDTTPVLLSLPYHRTYDPTTHDELVEVPEVVTCWEWPTARPVGVLVKQPEDVDGYPSYLQVPEQNYALDIPQARDVEWQPIGNERAIDID